MLAEHALKCWRSIGGAVAANKSCAFRREGGVTSRVNAQLLECEKLWDFTLDQTANKMGPSIEHLNEPAASLLKD